jgi:hypothetical protein
VDPTLLPADLRPKAKIKLAPAAYPVTQTNPITGYQTALYRSGTTSDFLGWLVLMNGAQAAGYIYVRRPVQPPYLGSTRYVVTDFPPELLDPLLRILQSNEPLQIRFFQAAPNTDAAAFLEHRI